MLTWDDPSERYFHHGVDRGVFYPSNPPEPVEDARNLATRPIPVLANVTAAAPGTGYSSDYYPAESTTTLIPDGNDGPIVDGVALAYRRKTITSASTTSARLVQLFTRRNPDLTGPFSDENGLFQVTPGKRYRISHYARANVAGATTIIQGSPLCRGFSIGSVSTYSFNGPNVTLNNNTWVRLTYVTPVIPAGITALAIRQTYATIPVVAGDTSDVTGLMIEDVTQDITINHPYFNGSSSNFLSTFEWAGAVNDSVSIRKQIIGTAFPWNGITGFDESGNGDSSIHYIDGRVYLADVDPTDFSGKLTAYSWPDQFSEALGFPEAADGLYVDNQKPKQFDFAYRSLIGSGSSGDMFGYQIHLVYKAMASFSGRSRKTINNNSDPIDFGFDLVCTPVALPQYRPSAHYVIDTRHLSKATVDQLEGILYGDATHAPRMPTPTELFDILNFGDAITFVKFTHPVLGECWTASGSFANVHYTGPNTFEILNVNGSWIDEPNGQYQLQDTP